MKCSRISAEASIFSTEVSPFCSFLLLITNQFTRSSVFSGRHVSLKSPFCEENRTFWVPFVLDCFQYEDVRRQRFSSKRSQNCVLSFGNVPHCTGIFTTSKQPLSYRSLIAFSVWLVLISAFLWWPFKILPVVPDFSSLPPLDFSQAPKDEALARAMEEGEVHN